MTFFFQELRNPFAVKVKKKENRKRRKFKNRTVATYRLNHTDLNFTLISCF